MSGEGTCRLWALVSEMLLHYVLRTARITTSDLCENLKMSMTRMRYGMLAFVDASCSSEFPSTLDMYRKVALEIARLKGRELSQHMLLVFLWKAGVHELSALSSAFSRS